MFFFQDIVFRLEEIDKRLRVTVLCIWMDCGKSHPGRGMEQTQSRKSCDMYWTHPLIITKTWTTFV